MRVGIDNGNGAICDKCGKSIIYRDIIKLKFMQLSEDSNKASSGIYKQINKKDLCISCYNNLLSQI